MFFGLNKPHMYLYQRKKCVCAGWRDEVIEKPAQNIIQCVKCALTEFFHGDDLILAHALAGLVIGQSSRVKETALDAFPEEKHSEKTDKVESKQESLTKEIYIRLRQSALRSLMETKCWCM